MQTTWTQQTKVHCGTCVSLEECMDIDFPVLWQMYLIFKVYIFHMDIIIASTSALYNLLPKYLLSTVVLPR